MDKSERDVAKVTLSHPCYKTMGLCVKLFAQEEDRIQASVI